MIPGFRRRILKQSLYSRQMAINSSYVHCLKAEAERLHVQEGASEAHCHHLRAKLCFLQNKMGNKKLEFSVLACRVLSPDQWTTPKCSQIGYKRDFKRGQAADNCGGISFSGVDMTMIKSLPYLLVPCIVAVVYVDLEYIHVVPSTIFYDAWCLPNFWLCVY